MITLITIILYVVSVFFGIVFGFSASNWDHNKTDKNYKGAIMCLIYAGTTLALAITLHLSAP